MENELTNNRVLKRKQSSEILIEQTTPPRFEQGTKVFVVGPPRSGTTLIYSLIAADEFSPECTFVSTLMKMFDSVYKYSDDERFEYYGHSLANLAAIYKKPICDFLFTAALKVGGVEANHFIYKDPILTLYLEYFPLFFDDSYKVIFCVRDPRDVVASMFNVLKKEKSEEDVDSLFEEAMNFILPFYRMIYFLDTSIVNIDKDKLLFVKYEDLVSGNVKSVQDLEKFLGVTVNLKDSNESVTGRLDPTSPFYSENYGQPATTQSIGKYRDSLTFEQIVDVEHVFSYYMDRLNYGRIGEPGFRQLEPQKNLQRISDLKRELQKSQQQTLSLQRELQKSQQQFYSSQHELQTSQQQVSSLQKELQQKLQEISHLNATLSRMPLASEELTIEKAEESLRNLYAYYYSKELPEVILLFERITKINARLIAANLCLRYGRYKRALEHLLRVGMMDPLALFSVQAIRITGNGLIHRRQRP